MRVSDVMTTEVVTVELTTPYKRLVELMLDRRITGLPVVDDAGRLLGLVTEADLVDKQAYGNPPEGLLGMVHQAVFGPPSDVARRAWALTAGGLMTSAVHTARPDEEIAPVARRLVEGNVKRLPVVDENGVVVGIVSRRDLLAVFARPDGLIEAHLRRVLADVLTVPEDAEIDDLQVRDGVVWVRGWVHHPSDIAVVAAAVRSVPGVVAADIDLAAREPEPELTGPPRSGPG